jgi:hypothetical protein
MKISPLALDDVLSDDIPVLLYIKSDTRESRLDPDAFLMAILCNLAHSELF